MAEVPPVVRPSVPAVATAPGTLVPAIPPVAEVATPDLAHRAEEIAAPVDLPSGGEPAEWPDDAAEAAFLAEARERGEPVKATPAAVEMAEEAADPKALPKLDDLVERIPADVREVLEDLFRAKFVRVQRVPRRVLKG